MISYKTTQEISILREGGKKLALALKNTIKAVRSGVSTTYLDKLFFDFIYKYGGKPSFLNYQPSFANKAFPSSLCASLNETVVHGIPSEQNILKEGDLISLDVGMEYKGLFTDMAVTVGVGRIDAIYKKLIKTTRQSLIKAIKASKLGNTLGDVGYAIQNCVKREGFVLVEGLVGHGVGYAQHEDPVVFNYGIPHEGLKLKEGMVIAIEPMVTFDNGTVIEKEDGSFITANGKVACHFEHTVAITKRGPIVITKD